MNGRFRKALWIAAMSLALPVLACRYSVRDTGFVDIGAVPYRLSLAAAALPESVAARYRQAAAAALLDSNVEFHPDAPEQETAAAPLALSDAFGRSLALIPGGSGDLPRAQADIISLMESVATSPARVRIQAESLRSFAVLVLIEGRDEAANQRVLQTLQSAVSAIERLLPGMPKPVSVPPQVISLTLPSQAAERVLLWGLGLDPGPANDPRLAIVYGRGRRLGMPLEGPAITRTGVQERLVLIGQDCECDLDRAWLQGPVIPGRWDRSLQETAARALGFDPENPRVRSEVSRIVLRGEGDRSRQQRPTTALALGYTEESIETGNDAPGDSAADANPPIAIGPASGGPSAPGGAAPDAAPAPASAAPLWLAVLGVFAVALGFGLWQFRRHTARHG